MLKRYSDKVPRQKTTLFNVLRAELVNVADAELEALFGEQPSSVSLGGS